VSAPSSLIWTKAFSSSPSVPTCSSSRASLRTC
jgi:hypothetical protein